MKIHILGCGGSGGVPLITGNWGKCDPLNPKNRRRRSSVLVQTDGKNILLDAGPDVREQLLDNKIEHIDAVIFTHAHADHTQGINELRHFSFYLNKKIPIYADEETTQYLKAAHKYSFIQQDEHYLPFLESHPLERNFFIENVNVKTISQQHGLIISWGIRIGNFAYSTDFNFISEESFEELRGVKCWIVDCLRFTPHLTHSHLDYTLSLINKLSPKQSILTHMSHECDYEEVKKHIPNDSVQPAFDGMVIEIAGEEVVICDKVKL